MATYMDPQMLGMLMAYGAKAMTGVFQASRAQRGLNALSKQPMPQFKITPEQTTSYNRAEELSRMGYTSGEKAALNQMLASDSNKAYRRATDIGGGSGARAIQGALGATRFNALNQLALNDAGLRRQNIRYADQVGSTLSGQRNMETQRAFNYRMELERALGAAKTQGVENIANSLGGFGANYAYMGQGATLNNPFAGNGQQTTPPMYSGNNDPFSYQWGGYGYTPPAMRQQQNPFITPNQPYPQQPIFVR